MTDQADLLPDAVLSYAARPDATIDLFLPPQLEDREDREDGQMPGVRTVFLLHGGFWRQMYDVTGVRPLARALARRGFVVAAPEYRRVGEGADGGWPMTCEDVEMAYAALPSGLPSVGVRPSSTIISGHSAGGHLALWLAARGGVAERVVALAPVGDLRDALETGMGDGAAAGFLGGEEPVNEADPARLFDTAQPAYPVIVVHGTADEPVPLANSRSLVARHPWIELREVEGADHMSMIDPDSPVHADVLAALEA